MFWTDTHAHLDAREFDADRDAVVGRIRAAGVAQVVIPAVAVWNFDRVRALAHAHGLSYGLGIHPMCTDTATDADLLTLRRALAERRDDPRLVAVGEIGVDHFVPGLDRARQERFYVAQLDLALEFDLPVLLHVRRSADVLLKHLRRKPVRGIAHAFNGSDQQADVFVALGFRLGFGGAMTFDRALQIRRIAARVPDHAIVLETDSPDIPPHWLYRTKEARSVDEPGDAGQARNDPSQLPRIAATLADLRGWSIEQTAAIVGANTLAALPKLARIEPTLPRDHAA